MSIQEKLYTADELWELSHQPEYSEKRLELSEGRLIEMSPSGNEHGIIALRLGRLIGNYVEEHDLGETTGSESGYILPIGVNPKGTVRGPDVGFISKARFEKPLEGYFTAPPDLAVEVVSPHDKLVEVEEKIDEYLRAGTRMIIVVYPKNRTLYVYTSATTRRLTIDDTLDGGDVLPGFSVTVRQIFKL